MSIFNAAARRSVGLEVRKEDIAHISTKITKKSPYHNWTEYYVQFKNEETNYWIRYNICLSKPDMNVEDILPILAKNGLDVKNVSRDGWNELIKCTGRYKDFKKWRLGQYDLAEKEGLSHTRNNMTYSYTTRKIRRGFYLVSITLKMYGETRKCKYFYNPSSSMYTTIKEGVKNEVENLINILPYTNLTKEEWDDNNFFNDLYDATCQSRNRYIRLFN